MDAKTEKELMAWEVRREGNVEWSAVSERDINGFSDRYERRPLESWIKKQERPFADENSQADIEGRPRPARSYGGVSGTGWNRRK